MTMLRAAVGVEKPRREATIDGVRIAYSDEGSGGTELPLVCLHAIGHGGGDFARIRARFGGRRRVITVDWPGQGHSGPDTVPAAVPRYERLLAGLLDAIGVERCVILGNSIGGATAFLHAVRAPERVAALVLENPGGLDRNDDAIARAALGMMTRFFAAGTRRARWFAPAFGVYYRMVLPCAAAAPQRRRIVAAAYELAPLLFGAWSGFGAPEADMRALAPRVRCPVLFAWATRDRFVQLRRARPTIATIPNARIVSYRAGHAAHLEDPDAFEGELERFLAALPADVPAQAQGRPARVAQ